MDENKGKGHGWLIFIIIAIVLVLAMAGGTEDSEYEKAGKEFETWMKEDPRTWSDTEKQYLDDLMKWSDEHRND